MYDSHSGKSCLTHWISALDSLICVWIGRLDSLAKSPNACINVDVHDGANRGVMMGVINGEFKDWMYVMNCLVLVIELAVVSI